MAQPFLPNTGDAFNPNQAEPDTVDFEALLAAYRGTGVLSGCLVSESSPAAQEVDIASGVVLLAWEKITVSAQADKAVTAANGSNPRFDLVTVNSSGTAIVTAGTAAAQPVLPGIPASSVLIAGLYIPTSDNVHQDAQLNDKRILIADRARAREVSTATTLDWSYSVVNVDSSGGTIIITLPDNAAFDGVNYFIHRDGSNVVTINRAGSDTFEDGDTSKTLDSDPSAIGIYSIGDTEWKIAGIEGTVGGS
jgi:hypothetical protein